MGRNKKHQALFDELGEEAYYEHKRVERNKKDVAYNNKINPKTIEILPGRTRKDQELFNEIGEEAYKKVKKDKRDNNKKQYNIKNKDKKAENYKIWRDNNKDKLKEDNKTWRKNNPEKVKIINKRGTDKFNSTYKGIRNLMTKSWRRNKITFGNTNHTEFYDNVYLPATHCNSCNKVFNNVLWGDKKCLDHIHLYYLSCNIRGIICHNCNANDAWRWRMRPDSIYNTYLEQYDLYIMEKKREYNLQNHLDLD